MVVMIQRQPATQPSAPSEPLDIQSWLMILGLDTCVDRPNQNEHDVVEPVRRCRFGTPFTPHHCELSLSPEEEERAMRAISEDGCSESKERLYCHGLQVLTRIVNAYEGRGLTTGELIEHGAHGLRLAIEHCDAPQGVRFSTIASWWIKQSIREAMRSARHPAVPA